MKTTIFTLASLMLLSGITCCAQTPALQKGSFLVGGGTDLTFANYKTELIATSGGFISKGSGTAITLSPQIGYFLGEGFALGGILNLTRSTTGEDDADEKYTVSESTIGPFMRYYTKSKIFFHGEYTFGRHKEKTTGQYDVDRTSKLSAWKLGIGYAAFLNSNIALEPRVMYAANSRKETLDQYEIRYGSGQITIGLTLTVFLPRN